MTRDEIIKKNLQASFKNNFSTIKEMHTFLKESKKSCYGFGWSYKFDEDGIGMNFSAYDKTLKIEFCDEILIFKNNELERLLVENVLENDNALGGLFQ